MIMPAHPGDRYVGQRANQRAGLGAVFQGPSVAAGPRVIRGHRRPTVFISSPTPPRPILSSSVLLIS